MTADMNDQKDESIQGTMFQRLTLIFAGLTLLFAVGSMIMGNRMRSLHAEQLKIIEQSTISETASIEKLRSQLEEARTGLETAKAETVAEKKITAGLEQQLTALQKDLSKVKADLDAAHQAVSTLDAPRPAKPSSSSETRPLPEQAPQPAAQSSDPAQPGQTHTLSAPATQSSGSVEPDAHSSVAAAPRQAAVDRQSAPSAASDSPEAVRDKTPQPSLQPKEAQ